MNKTIQQINKEKQLEKIKQNFNWEEYIHLNPELKTDLKSIDKAWIHFKKFGYDKGLQWSTHNYIDDASMKILVVMPTYNRSNKIESAIQMIQKQTFINWMFLIIDDGSELTHKLKFKNIKEKYKNNRQLVFLENITNCHIAKTLNIGIDYLLSNSFTHFTWISDDNKYYSNFLKTLIINNTYFTYSAYYVQTINNKQNLHSKHYNNYLDLINTWTGCASFMWTKNAIQQIGYYNETVPMCEDYEYLIRTFKINSKHCNFINIPLVTYIYHNSSLSTLYKSDIIKLHFEISIKYKNDYNDCINIKQSSKITTPLCIEHSHEHYNEHNFGVLNEKRCKIVSNKYLLTGTLMLQKCLEKIGLVSDIIFNIEENYSDDNFYIIIFSKSKKVPKNFIYWQIEQTSMIESPIQKFTEFHISTMNKSLAIFEISPDNISHYKDKITESKKLIYNQLPFNDIYQQEINDNIRDYDYDIIFFGTKSSRRELILNKLENILSKKYRIKYLFGVNGEKRDKILKKTKYLLNVHYYEDAKLECDRFNIAINCNCLILSENCIGDVQNKENYNYFITYFDNIYCSNNNINIEQMINVIEYNLRDDVFLNKKQNYMNEKQKLENIYSYYLHKNLLSLNYFKNLDINIYFDITEPVYCISLIEDDSRYSLMMSQKNVITHKKFPAFKHKVGHIGYNMSYYTLIYNCKKQNIHTITIFEDNVLFKDTFNNTYQIVKQFLQYVKWDIFNGYSCSIENESDILEYYTYEGVTFLKIKKMVGLGFNIYNKSAYDSILEYDYFTANNNPQDGNNQIVSVINKNDTNIFICYPSLVTLLPLASTIDFHNENETNAIIEKFIQNNKPIEITRYQE